jgi:cobalt-zinc-cadmium resistance protein CzcA
MQSFVHFVRKNRVIVLGLLAAFVGAGIYSALRLPVEAFPDVTNLQVQVITLWPGHAAEEVEKLVSVPVENALNGVPERIRIQSVSQFGLSQVMLTFDDSADGETARNRVNRELQSVALPTGAQASMAPDATPIGEIFRYTLKGPKDYPSWQLKSIEDHLVERRMRSVPGVVDVVGFGGPTKEYQVVVDPARLRQHDVTLNQVIAALQNANRNAGGSYVEIGPEMFVVRGLGMLQTMADMGEVAVATRDTGAVKVKDVATVAIGAKTRLGRVGFLQPGGAEEDDTVSGTVLLRRGADPLRVVKEVQAAVSELNAGGLPPGVRIEVQYDRGDLVNRTLSTAGRNVSEGILLVIGVLLLFLGVKQWRAALIVGSVIPISLLGAFLFLQFKGVPANLISIGAIDFGIIIDAAVVVVESVLLIRAHRHAAQEAGRTANVDHCVAEAFAVVGKPVLFAKMILLCAFLPLFALERVEGRIFRPMAFTLTFALLTGVLMAFTLIPALSRLTFRKEAEEEETWLVGRLNRAYRPLLAWAMAFPKKVMLWAFGGLALGAALLLLAGSEFLPKLDEGAFWVRVSMPLSISPSESQRVVARARGLIGKVPEVRRIISYHGQPDDGTDINGFDVAELFVDLKDRSQWRKGLTTPDIVQEIQAQLNSLPGVDTEISQPIADNVNEAVSGIKGGDLGVKIYGEDPALLKDLAERIAKEIRTVEGAAEVAVETLDGQPQIRIVADRAALTANGVSVNDLQNAVETSLSGMVATQVLDGETLTDVTVKIDRHLAASPEAIGRIPVGTDDGRKLTIDRLAKVQVGTGFQRIKREENRRRLAVLFAARGRDMGSVVAEAQAKVAKAVAVPPGYRLQWAGAFENQQRAARRLGWVVPISLVAICFLLYTMLRSMRLSGMVLLSLPFTAAGGMVALFASGLPVSVSSLAGFVTLIGLAVQNKLLLLEQILENRAQRIGTEDAVRMGAQTRVRAVVMTASMAILGLLPAALSHAVGSETARPFATAIIGGMIFDIPVTLLVFPALFARFEPGESALMTDEDT